MSLDTPSLFPSVQSSNGFALAKPVDIKTLQEKSELSTAQTVEELKTSEQKPIFEQISSTSESTSPAVETIAEKQKSDSVIIQASLPAPALVSSPHDLAKPQAPDHAKEEVPISVEPAATEDEALCKSHFQLCAVIFVVEPSLMPHLQRLNPIRNVSRGLKLSKRLLI